MRHDGNLCKLTPLSLFCCSAAIRLFWASSNGGANLLTVRRYGGRWANGLPVLRIPRWDGSGGNRGGYCRRNCRSLLGWLVLWEVSAAVPAGGSFACALGVCHAGSTLDFGPPRVPSMGADSAQVRMHAWDPCVVPLNGCHTSDLATTISCLGATLFSCPPATGVTRHYHHSHSLTHLWGGVGRGR